jgi:DNA mismatch repair protein MLH1
MYQQVLRRFGQFNCIRLSTPAPLDQLLLIALDEEEALGRWQPNDGPKEEIAKVGSLYLVKTTRFLEEDDPQGREECCILGSEILV